LDERELRHWFLLSVLAVQRLPFLFQFRLARLFLLFLVLPEVGQSFELFFIDLHVGADDLERDRGHRLVPVRLLLRVHEALHHHGVALCLVSFDHADRRVRIQEQERLLRRLVVHALRRKNQALQQVRAILCELNLRVARAQINDLLNFTNKDDFLGRRRERPIPQKASDQLQGQRHMLF